MKQNTIQENQLADGKIGRLILKFAVPSVAAMLVNALYNIVDQIFIGHGVGYLGNGAANVVLLITMMTLALSLLIGDGAAALYSLSLGRGEQRRAERAAGNAAAVITVVSIVATIGILCFLKPILRLLGCTEVILPYAMEYGPTIVLGLPFIMISTSLNSLIRADGSPRYAMISMITGAVVNACLDPILIFGLDLGILGAAVATWIGQLVSFVLSVAYLKKFRCVRFTRSSFRPDFKIILKICTLGISSFIDQTAFTLVMAVNNNLIVKYGAMSSYGSEIPLTAYGISMKVQEILFTVLLGIAIGMQPIVGYNYGAGRFGRVRQAYWTAIGIGTAVSAAATVLFLCFPAPVIQLFGAQENGLYLDFAEKFFRTYFLLYLFFGFQTISGIFFQAIGKPVKAAALSLSYQLVFKIVPAVVLSALIGLDGVLWSGPAADFMAFLLGIIMVTVQMKELKRQQA